jgi:hypothetical protein
LARYFDQAQALLETAQGQAPAEWQPALANERAALAWHRGLADEGRALWQALPRSAPVLFNRGMAALFFDQPKEARTSLAEAATGLPESSGWHHLARLYRTVAEIRISGSRRR